MVRVIGSKRFLPYFTVCENALVKKILSKSFSFAITFLAEGASLKPRAVAVAVASGVISCNSSDFGFSNANGESITFGDAARVVRSFSRAHSAYVKQVYARFNKAMNLSAKRFNAKKAARRAAGVRASCKRILAQLDAAPRVPRSAMRAILKAHAEDWQLRQKQSAFFRALRQSKREEQQRNVVVAETVVHMAPASLRRQYICPLRGSCTEQSYERGRSSERISRSRSTSLSPVPGSQTREVAPLFRECNRAAKLDFSPVVKSFFSTAPLKAKTFAEVANIARLAQLTCRYYERFPLTTYFDCLKVLQNDTSRTMVDKLCLGMEVELQRIDDIMPNEQIANGMLSFVAGCAIGGATMVGGIVGGAKTVIDHAVEGFKTCAATMVDTVGQATEVFGETIFKLVRKQFDSCLGSFLAPFMHARAKIENYWRAAKEWFTKMWTNMSIEIQALFESTWWALALLLVAGLVFLAEKLLVSFEVLSVAGPVTALFVTGFLLAMGWNVYAPASEAESTLMGTLRALVFGVIGGTPHNTDSGTTANSVSLLEFPLRILETLGTGLMSAPLGTLQYAGKYGQALDQIRKGKDAMKEFIGWCFDRIADAWDYMTGRKDTFFREISSMTKVNIVPWIEKSQRLILEAQTVAVTDPVLMDTVTHLLYQGHTLQVTLAGAKRTTSLDYGRVVSSLMVELNKVRAQCARAGIFEGRRCEPFWVYIYGKSHCGKSLFMEDVSRRLLKENGHAPNDIYAKNARDSFWSGYLRQACVQLDDLSACVTEPSVESEFLQTVGSKDYKLNMAAVEDKGMSFNSSIIVTTSNVFSAPTDAKILDSDAYKNRRGAVVQCRRAQGVEFDPSNPSASCEARLVDEKDETPICDWVNCTKVLEEIVERNRKHRNKELTLMANYRTRNEALHPIHEGAKGFLQSCTKVLAVSQLACDGKLYSIDKVAMRAELVKEKPNADIEKFHILQIDDLKTAISNRACSGMLNTFLYSLVEGPCEVASVDALCASSTESQRTFFLELPLLERVYLRLLQKRIQMYRDIPDLGFNVNIKQRILSSLADGYQTVCKHGGKLLTILAALVLILVIYSTFFSIFRMFVHGGDDGPGVTKTLGLLTLNAGAISSVYSSSEGSTARYSTRNIPIQYRNVSGMGLLANSGGKDDYLMSLIVWLEIPGGGLISCIRGKGRFVYLTKHQAEAIPNGARVDVVSRLTDGSARSVRIIWDEKNVRSYSGTEAVTYHDACFTPLPEPSKTAFDVDIDQLPTLFDINVVVVKRKSNLRHVDPSLQALPAEQPIIDRWSSNAKINREMQSFSTYALGGSYRNEIPISIVSKCPTYAEDCGAILTTMWKGQRRVIGMHVASGYTKGTHKSWTSTATLLPTLTDLTCDSGLNIIEESGVSYPGYRKLGYIPKVADRPYISGKTMFVPVPEAMRYTPTDLVETFSDGSVQKIQVEIKQPAILTSTDPRIPAGVQYDPLKQGMEKFKQPMDLLDEALCHEIVMDIADSWHDCLGELEDVSDTVAINGAEDEFFDKFNMQTSEGYPWVRQRGIGESGKSRFFEEDGNSNLKLRIDTPVKKAYDDLQEQCKVGIPELVCIETPKDECLPLRKITQKPKTRLFSILPLEYNLFLRKKFLAFAASLQRNRDTLPTQVGVDPYSREWGHIFSRLRSKNEVAVNCDYASFDGLITAQILRHIGNAINKAYNDSMESQQQRHNLLMAIVNRKSICGSQVYEVSAGIPSGCALTVLLNSIFNEMLIRYVWKITVVGVPREMFSTYVTLIIYGDDNLIAVHPEFLGVFNGQIIQDKLKEVGVTITDGSDKTAIGIYEKPFERLDFLKRRFSKQSDGTVLAPLDLASIFTSLQNVTLGAGSVPAAVQQNVHSALTELYLHQNVQWFDDLRDFYVKQHGWSNLPTWRQVHAFHREHMTGVLPWAPHRMQDIPVNTEKIVRAMANQGEADYTCQVAERIFVCGPRFNASQIEKHFVVSHTGALKRGEHGLIRVPAFVSEGKGRLPTQLWVKQFRSSTHHDTCLIQDAYKRGCSIYFRGDPPYITNWLSATSTALGLGMDYRAILNLYHNVCTPDATCLDTYFEAQRFRRVDKYRPPAVTNRL
uniref:RNA1 polyprotein n=1 Tax=Chinese milk vetch nepovirus TaxID=3115761 RepID=A0AAT9JH49_9SECO